jgi:hypothetical protein
MVLGTVLENTIACIDGGSVAKDARDSLERQLKKSVISSETPQKKRVGLTNDQLVAEFRKLLA